MLCVMPTSCFLYCKDTIFRANHNHRTTLTHLNVVVSYIAKIRFFEQITTQNGKAIQHQALFLILQRYDFSSKSQHKPTPFVYIVVVSYIAKIRFFEQITTNKSRNIFRNLLFLILQRYDFSSKSQHWWQHINRQVGCFLYCKDTIFRANHNS